MVQMKPHNCLHQENLKILVYTFLHFFVKKLKKYEIKALDTRAEVRAETTAAATVQTPDVTDGAGSSEERGSRQSRNRGRNSRFDSAHHDQKLV